MDICLNCSKEISGYYVPNASCPFCGSPILPDPLKPVERFSTEILNAIPSEPENKTVLESLTMFPDKTVLESDPDKTFLDDNMEDFPGMKLFFAWLVFLDKEGHPLHDVRITREKNIIGKGIDADIQVNDDFASKLHAIIHYQAENNTFTLTDLGSTNHTWLKEKIIVTEPLDDGDRIRIGHQEMIFKKVRRFL